MRVAFTRLLVLAVVSMMTPGLVEAAENLWHLAENGHAAHAAEEAGHEPEGDEHGCSGTFHLCSCHASTSTTMPGMRAAQTLVAVGSGTTMIVLDVHDPDSPRLDRPPQR